METLIELYDERPFENVLGVEMFRPARVVYICPETAAGDAMLHRTLHAYFTRRGLQAELIFFKANVYDTNAVLVLLRTILAHYPDCAIDITGGTDAVLFAAGLLCAETGTPVFTYSRKRNCLYDIQNAPFAEALPCDLRYRVEDFFAMAGGSVREGRVDNAVLARYLDDFDPFLQVYLQFQQSWTKIVTYFQRISPTAPDGSWSPDVKGPYTVKGERGSRIDAPEEALRELEQIGLIRDLHILRQQRAGRHVLPRRGPAVHQLQDLRDPHRGAQRAGRSARPLRRTDGPRRHRHGRARQRPRTQPRLRAEHPCDRPA